MRSNLVQRDLLGFLRKVAQPFLGGVPSMSKLNPQPLSEPSAAACCPFVDCNALQSYQAGLPQSAAQLRQSNSKEPSCTKFCQLPKACLCSRAHIIYCAKRGARNPQTLSPWEIQPTQEKISKNFSQPVDTSLGSGYIGKALEGERRCEVTETPEREANLDIEIILKASDLKWFPVNELNCFNVSILFTKVLILGQGFWIEISRI